MSEWTVEEWERRKASLLEDVRILQAEIDEQREDVKMLRERGHDMPAEVMEHHIKKAEAIIERVIEGFEEANA